MYCGGPPTAIDSILAANADGGQGIVDIDREVGRNKLIQWWPWPTPSAEAPRGGVCSPDKTMPLEGQTAPSRWGCMCLCVSLAKTFRARVFRSRRNGLRC